MKKFLILVDGMEMAEIEADAESSFDALLDLYAQEVGYPAFSDLCDVIDKDPHDEADRIEVEEIK